MSAESDEAARPETGEALQAELAAAQVRAADLEAEYESLLADPGVIQEDRDAHRLMLDAARRDVATAREALARLEGGSYGRCRRCGDAISAERLEAVPDATECVECASGRR